MYERILVPLDGSAFGEYALPFAGTVARATGAAVELVHVHACRLPEPYLEGITPYQFEQVYEHDLGWEQECIEAERQRLEQAAAALRSASVIEVTTRLLEGPTVQTLRQHAEELPADMVVMSTHGRSGLERAWLGSVADALIRQVSMPVLLIRPAAEAAVPPERPAFDRILLPLDGSSFSEQALAPTAALAARLGSHVTLLQVVGPTPPTSETLPPRLDVDVRRSYAEEYMDQVAAGLGVAEPRVSTEVRVDRRPASAILEAAGAVGADLIAMATHGRGGVSRLLLGSTADKVLRAAVTPLLLLRPRAQKPEAETRAGTDEAGEREEPVAHN